MNKSPSDIFWILLFLERYQQKCQTVLAATGMNWLTFLHSEQSGYMATFIMALYTYASFSNSHGMCFMINVRLLIDFRLFAAFLVQIKCKLSVNFLHRTSSSQPINHDTIKTSH